MFFVKTMQKIKKKQNYFLVCALRCRKIGLLLFCSMFLAENSSSLFLKKLIFCVSVLFLFPAIPETFFSSTPKQIYSASNFIKTFLFHRIFKRKFLPNSLFLF